jgi:hypothetical protein
LEEEEKEENLKKKHEVEEKKISFFLHAIVAKLVDADCFAALSPA